MAVRYRSSVTGRWVTKRFAKRHPRTTEAERGQRRQGRAHHGCSREQARPQGLAHTAPRIYDPRMGLFRKITSVSTMGAVDYRSDKERTAAYTKATKKQAKQQTALVRQQVAMQRAQMQTPQSQPGWFPDQHPGWLRWWDGYRWTEHVRPM